MAPPTPVTDPGVQRSVTVPPPAVAVVRIMSAPPLCSDTSSENGGTGRSSGTSTSAMSEPWSTATTEAGRRRPPGPTMSMWRRPERSAAVVATWPPSATATPTWVTVPWLVTARSSTIELPAALATRGIRVVLPARVVSGASDAASVVAVGVEGGASWASRMPTDTAADTAATAPTSIMMRVRR